MRQCVTDESVSPMNLMRLCVTVKICIYTLNLNDTVFNWRICILKNEWPVYDRGICICTLNLIETVCNRRICIFTLNLNGTVCTSPILYLYVNMTIHFISYGFVSVLCKTECDSVLQTNLYLHPESRKRQYVSDVSVSVLWNQNVTDQSVSDSLNVCKTVCIRRIYIWLSEMCAKQCVKDESVSETLKLSVCNRRICIWLSECVRGSL
jgi:hypothetical protein